MNDFVAPDPGPLPLRYVKGRKGFFVGFGKPGGGKSEQGAKAFQNCLAILTGPTNLQFYEMWLQTAEGRASGKVLPRRTFVLDMYSLEDSAQPDKPIVAQTIMANGRLQQVHQAWWLQDILTKVTLSAGRARANNQEPPFWNLIIDELGELVRRVYDQFPVFLNKDGKPDPLKGWNEIEKWTIDIVNQLRALRAYGMNVYVTAHTKEPEIEKEKVGGPKFPSQAVMGAICAPADGVLMRALEDVQVEVDLSSNADQAALLVQITEARKLPSRRYWRAHASEHWLSKLRGLPDAEFFNIREMPLEKIVTMAGYCP